MMLKEYWTEIVMAIGGIISFFAGRKSQKNQDQQGELENIQKVREIEKTLLADMEEQINKLVETNNRLEEIVEKQSRKLRSYEVKFGYLEESNHEEN